MAESALYVIVGASLTGGRAAETLRERGFAGRIVLVGGEPDRPYERPPLSKGYLQGKTPEAEVYLRPPSFYEEQRIELKLGRRATALLASERAVLLDDGEQLPYDKLLIATGSELRRLQTPGSDLPGVHYLRTLRDAERLAAALKEARRPLVVGAGFVGLEVAASVRALGREVTVLDPSPVPLERALGTEMGRVVEGIHRDRGVDLRLTTGLAELRGDGRVEQAVTTTGERIDCDLALVGIGVTPVVDWLAGSGIALDGGVLVNEFAETNLPDIYAAGDVAVSWNPLLGRHIRVGHYDNAQNQGLAAASVMAGTREPYDPVPYFWSDQYDLTLQCLGLVEPSDRPTIRGDLAGRSFTAFYLSERRVRAAVSIGRPRDITAARRLIRSGKEVDPTALVDEQVDLRALAR